MTLPELNRRLLAEPLVALLAVPPSRDEDTTPAHFPSARRPQPSLLVFPNGSSLHYFRTSFPDPQRLCGLSLDLAVVLTPWPERAVDELRKRLARRHGVLFAPFNDEAPASEEGDMSIPATNRPRVIVTLEGERWSIFRLTCGPVFARVSVEAWCQVILSEELEARMFDCVRHAFASGAIGEVVIQAARRDDLTTFGWSPPEAAALNRLEMLREHAEANGARVAAAQLGAAAARAHHARYINTLEHANHARLFVGCSGVELTQDDVAEAVRMVGAPGTLYVAARTASGLAPVEGVSVVIVDAQRGNAGADYLGAYSGSGGAVGTCSRATPPRKKAT